MWKNLKYFTLNLDNLNEIYTRMSEMTDRADEEMESKEEVPTPRLKSG